MNSHVHIAEDMLNDWQFTLELCYEIEMYVYVILSLCLKQENYFKQLK